MSLKKALFIVEGLLLLDKLYKKEVLLSKTNFKNIFTNTLIVLWIADLIYLSIEFNAYMGGFLNLVLLAILSSAPAIVFCCKYNSKPKDEDEEEKKEEVEKIKSPFETLKEMNFK